MRIDLYRADDGQFYVCFPGIRGALLWHQEGDRWTHASVELPADPQPSTLTDLPADLREEILAFATRVEALGNQLWVDNN